MDNSPGVREHVGTDGTLPVELTRAKAQREEEERQRHANANPSAPSHGSVDTTEQAVDGAATPPPASTTSATIVKNTRFWGSHTVDPERFSRDLNRLSQDLLALLTAADGVELEVRVEISARRADGFPDDTVMKVLENLGPHKVEGKFEDL